MPIVTVGTARIPYRVVGAGPALVLVHGTGPGSGMWDVLLDRFTDRHTVLLPDLSGSVDAEDDGGEITVEGLAEQVAAVIRDAGAGPADVVGFSMGSTVAVATAALYPELVRHLVPVSAWVASRDDAYLVNLMRVWAASAADPDAFGRLAMITAFSTTFLNSVGPEAVEGIAAYMRPLPGTLRHIDLDARVDLRPLLPKVTAPTLVVGGTRDATIPVHNARRLHAELPGSSYAEFDTGHIVFAEEPEPFLAALHDFLATPVRAGALAGA
ncbi:alpha/beta hydrolase [Kitasatospora sp. NA04385]|uniref:alpha/beta fold hydrolase n=1 Tax=Kitasatospora sp. NA04385 TaxID=2742135 RepID=UPI001590A4A1|nr:alpha/beta hydrolase [Kitasatospora sp. NA04385]QKW20911.1 alpha/beta hydrolase [Kitasatospora sp. NA04385]